MEITRKYHKTETIKNWKYKGIINENLEEIYETYINTMNCGHCGKVFEKLRDRCMDHCHETGLFRKIVCNRCNAMDSYINYPAGYDRKKYHKEYQVVNREKIKEYAKKYRENNKEKIKEKNKKYREKNRDKINERRRELKKEKKAIMINLT